MDINLHYMETGAGEALILLHGNGEEGGYFAHQLAYFSKKYRVIALDTRGHGKSPRGSAEFSIRQFAEDLHAFMDVMGIESAHILGFSDGGNIALCFALKYPERVKKLILNGANLHPRGVKPAVQLPVEIGWRWARLFAKESSSAARKAELLGLMVLEPRIAPEALAALSMPVLVIAGDRDMIRDSHTRLIARSIPGAQLCILKGDHFIASKQHAEFNRAVERFLEG